MVVKLEAELERQRLERDWSESELDRVKDFWEITKRDLEEKRTEMRNMESNLEGAEERHQLEIKVMYTISFSHSLLSYLFLKWFIQPVTFCTLFSKSQILQVIATSGANLMMRHHGYVMHATRDTSVGPTYEFTLQR